MEHDRRACVWLLWTINTIVVVRGSTTKPKFLRVCPRNDVDMLLSHNFAPRGTSGTKFRNKTLNKILLQAHYSSTTAARDMSYKVWQENSVRVVYVFTIVLQLLCSVICKTALNITITRTNEGSNYREVGLASFPPPYGCSEHDIYWDTM